jgi:hypothetical protein
VQNEKLTDVKNKNIVPVCFPSSIIDTPENVGNDGQTDHVDSDQETECKRYPSRERKVPKHFDDFVLDDQFNCNVDYCYRLVLDVPKTFDEAISGPDSDHWQKAMSEEMESLKDNQTFNVTTLPNGRQAVGGRWVYTIKEGPDGSMRHKARYVAKGYSQVEGVDYFETFSPTARMTSVRTVMQLAVQHDLIVHQLDVKNSILECSDRL